jgi:hypothetical protein
MRSIHLVILALLGLSFGRCAALPTAIVPTPQMRDATATPADGWAELRLRTPYPYTTPLPPPATTPLDGTYVKTDPHVVEQMPCRRCPPYPPAGGLWRLNLDRGTFRIYHADTGWRSLGSYTVTGDTINFFNDPHCIDAVGVYTWAAGSGELRLQQAKDACGGDLRARSLTAQPWLSCQPPSVEAATTDHWSKPLGCPAKITQDSPRR